MRMKVINRMFYKMSPTLIWMFLILHLISDGINFSEACYEWSYGECDDKTNWDSYEACREKNGQSPIVIKQINVKADDTYTKTPIKFGKYQYEINRTLLNTGKAAELFVNMAQFYYESSKGLVPYVYDEKFRENPYFYLAQVSFHWGRNDHEGCEHIIEENKNVNCGFEIQLLHLNNENFKAKKSFYLGVALTFKVTEKDNDATAFEKITQALTNYKKKANERSYIKGTEIELELFKLRDLLPQNSDSDAKDFEAYAYNGSLTMPPCSQTVVWYVYAKPLEIGTKQVALFRDFCAGGVPCEPIKCNFRKARDSGSLPIYKALISITYHGS